ncbi:MAG: 1-(5-phosphoribosyl)-5-[(5-phosphoribosylamino)methylideneamino]imidazole-4-carboxamide isomerase [Aestuariivita sp.]|nr:1-(5-phosphoribosyl)-5-[(5-phosphoribosylamino)methylideneamino]imidazole-4-carboxamide isomerase [Aestuariivita sp.]MCY4203715.1 1-(5-phosphoribosyl)-5-[(5-phosphoribosylamino)methylideneamino]imidazole-4-carboxamide isomerase [Aestuariivita sp.]MCY4289093.1 1-(5-phosphoribosyl)-5-[(5-phosphoribosylamino)methylideneamino]imidazole-4-carboxamide isomerase [Aestuariivita sp.]MCY4347693.1 1-(5-phosphoribosyl)-5-[(5-phosphoribosylamino)methylideneamino]imidazole-4-carboxamide isomerase [Aestuari
MILFPAIDIKDGQAVRLLRGAMDAVTIFNDDPAQQAQEFEAAGCHWLHLVDLDGAVSGYPTNSKTVEGIIASVDIPLQLGGGIRELAMIEYWLEKGLSRVILGTIAVENPQLVRKAARDFPDKIVVGIDARQGLVATKGWVTDTDLKAEDLAKSFEDAGVAAIIYTDINRDGAMLGPNVAATAQLAQSVSVPVIASGGVSSENDLLELRDTGVIAGAICGRALYDGTLDIRQAIAVLEG